MEKIIFFVIFSIVIIAISRNLLRRRYQKRQKFIDSYTFPKKVSERVLETYPHLDDNQVEEAVSGLRDYFYLCSRSPKGMVSMPSQVVDVAWHEFILFTREYQNFCKKAFGRFLHHTPAEAMKHPNNAQQGIKRAWRLACEFEGVATNTRERKRGLSFVKDPLPQLFTLDSKLKIPDGFHYKRNCSDGEKKKFCANDIGCSSALSAYGLSGALAIMHEGSWSSLDYDSGSGDGSNGGDGGGCGGD